MPEVSVVRAILKKLIVICLVSVITSLLSLSLIDAENLLAKLGHWEMPNVSFVIKVVRLFTPWIVRDQTLYSALSNVLEVVIESL